MVIIFSGVEIPLQGRISLQFEALAGSSLAGIFLCSTLLMHLFTEPVKGVL